MNCHDTDGRGEIGRDLSAAIPDFTSESWQTSRSDAQLRRAITEGQGPSMPAMKGKLSPGEVASLVALIRAFQDGRQRIQDDVKADRKEAMPTPNAAVAAARPNFFPTRETRNASGTDARFLYQRSCRSCHGENGKGERTRAGMPEIPDFTNGMWPERRNPAEMTVSILDGKGRHMPAFGESLSNEQARSLVEFIQAFGPNRARVAEAPAGDFDIRYAELREEFDSLRREYRAMSPTPPKSKTPLSAPGVKSSAPKVR